MPVKKIFHLIIIISCAAVVLGGCGAVTKPVQQAMDGIRMAREGNEMGREALRVAKEMNEKLLYETKLQQISKEILDLTDAEIPKRDNAAGGAEFAIIMVRKVNRLADESFRKALMTEKVSREQQRMAQLQLRYTRRLYQIAKTTDKLSREGKILLEKSLTMAKEGAGMK